MGPRREELRRRSARSWLAQERERRGLLQRPLAAQLGVSQQAYSGYENGRTRVPDDVAARLAELWDIEEMELRAHLGLHVPADVAGRERPEPDLMWPDTAIRLPKGVKLTDLEPHEQAALEKIVDAFIDSVRADDR